MSDDPGVVFASLTDIPGKYSKEATELSSRIERIVARLRELPSKTAVNVRKVHASPQGGAVQFFLRFDRDGSEWSLQYSDQSIKGYKSLTECSVDQKIRATSAIKELLQALIDAQTAQLSEIRGANQGLSEVERALGMQLEGT